MSVVLKDDAHVTLVAGWNSAPPAHGLIEQCASRSGAKFNKGLSRRAPGGSSLQGLRPFCRLGKFDESF